MLHQLSQIQRATNAARVVDCGTNLAQAKRKASKEFGDGLLNARIVILDAETGETVTSRTVCQRVWS